MNAVIDRLDAIMLYFWSAKMKFRWIFLKNFFLRVQKKEAGLI